MKTDLSEEYALMAETERYETERYQQAQDVYEWQLAHVPLLREDCMLVGSIQLYAVDSFPEGVLPCDGASYLRTDYPALYDVLSISYITDADNFTVPDLYQGDDMKYGIVAECCGENYEEALTAWDGITQTLLERAQELERVK